MVANWRSSYPQSIIPIIYALWLNPTTIELLLDVYHQTIQSLRSLQWLHSWHIVNIVHICYALKIRLYRLLRIILILFVNCQTFVLRAAQGMVASIVVKLVVLTAIFCSLHHFYRTLVYLWVLNSLIYWSSFSVMLILCSIDVSQRRAWCTWVSICRSLWIFVVLLPCWIDTGHVLRVVIWPFHFFKIMLLVICANRWHFWKKWLSSIFAS